MAGGCKRALRWWERDTDGLPASPPKNEKVDLLAHKCGNALPNEHTYDAAGSKEGKQGQTDSGGHDRAVSLEQAEARDDQFIKVAKDILGLQENALMAIGGDYTARLRQLHDQVMVLRGAAFNGVIGFFLCVFMWSATLRNGGPVSRLGWMALGVVPITLIVLTKIAAHHHFYDREPADPFVDCNLGQAHPRRQAVEIVLRPRRRYVAPACEHHTGFKPDGR